MEPIVNPERLKTSWTKYDIVDVMSVIYDVDTILRFKNKEATIDEPILKSFLGITSLSDPIPEYWLQIQRYPEVKKLFALLAVIFTHFEVIELFAQEFSAGEMRGIFRMKETGKMFTNIRSALVESGAASPSYRKEDVAPYDFSPLLQNAEAGILFKQVLLNRVSRITKGRLTDSDFFSICIRLGFHRTLSLAENDFKRWLEGQGKKEEKKGEIRLIKTAEIANFFSVEKVRLDFSNTKEIYLLGENGDGKSLILMGIYLAFNGTFIKNQTDLGKTGKVIDIIRSNPDITLTGEDEKGQTYSADEGAFLVNLFAYGTHRGRYSADKPEEYGFMSLFDSEQTLMSPVAWLRNQRLLEFEKRMDSHNMFPEAKDLPYSYPEKALKNMFYELLEKHVEIKFSNSEIIFVEKGTELTFDQLSEGYKSILIFVVDLLYRLSQIAGKNQEPAGVKAVVIVDEIDLHLHPKWQRGIIQKLRKLFPNVQFIFSTHSPNIIQGASDEAVLYRVYRNKEDGKTRISDAYYRKDLNHLMINTLLTSPLFGLQDSRMNPKDDNSDTSDTYLLYKINKRLEQELEKQKAEGRTFIGEAEIDNLIQKLLNDELKK